MEELEKDKAILDWLEANIDRAKIDRFGADDFQCSVQYKGCVWNLHHSTTLRKAIDKAMNADNPK